MFNKWLVRRVFVHYKQTCVVINVQRKKDKNVHRTTIGTKTNTFISNQTDDTSGFCSFDDTKLKLCYVSFSDKRPVPTHSLIMNASYTRASFNQNIFYCEILMTQSWKSAKFEFWKCKNILTFKHTHKQKSLVEERLCIKHIHFAIKNCDTIFMPSKEITFIPR